MEILGLVGKCFGRSGFKFEFEIFVYFRTSVLSSISSRNNTLSYVLSPKITSGVK